MAVQKKFALGRGLDALISTNDEVKTSGSSSINEVELSKISVNPNQPRREFDPIALQELADSIAEIGIIQPITLRKLNEDSYQIIAGERRYRASIQAGLKTIPAYIRTADDENVMEMALIENIQREDLNSLEIALAYQHLIEQYELTQERLSERVGKKRTTIANYLRLLKLPAPIQVAAAISAENARSGMPPSISKETPSTENASVRNCRLKLHSRKPLWPVERINGMDPNNIIKLIAKIELSFIFNCSEPRSFSICYQYCRTSFCHLEYLFLYPFVISQIRRRKNIMGYQ